MIEGRGLRKGGGFSRVLCQKQKQQAEQEGRQLELLDIDDIDVFKGALKAHIHISLYESNTLQEQDAAFLFLSVIP